ncbi:uncharacterized protein F4812DRAFT_454941 [Daldinia caldariorum]|uniref:uncharacterized protein n=1 Tax=Daldinia caldariorum TaxID=326644 RepID=UPI0020074E57|nr:uncharacterized protein F4812DRAFT_454941 [Daldinia caldariorum]KAI1473124.1 hypothetical protein F4812DRAFT_454941 [Daldinia caldariorum]
MRYFLLFLGLSSPFIGGVSCRSHNLTQLFERGISVASLELSPGSELYFPGDPEFDQASVRWTNFSRPTFSAAVLPALESELALVLEFGRLGALPTALLGHSSVEIAAAYAAGCAGRRQDGRSEAGGRGCLAFLAARRACHGVGSDEHAFYASDCSGRVGCSYPDQYRHGLGLPTTILNICPVDGAGYVADNLTAHKNMKAQGLFFLGEQEFLDFVQLNILHPNGGREKAIGSARERYISCAGDREEDL